MAVPSGSGTELLRSSNMNTLSSTFTTFKFASDWAPSVGTSSYAIPANHIITIHSIIFTEQGAADETIMLYASDAGGTGANIYWLEASPILAYDTFVWNTKAVLIGGDKLGCRTGSAANVDVWWSFLDQEWS